MRLKHKIQFLVAGWQGVFALGSLTVCLTHDISLVGFWAVSLVKEVYGEEEQSKFSFISALEISQNGILFNLLVHVRHEFHFVIREIALSTE